MGIFDSDSKRSMDDNEEGQKDGSKAGFLDEMGHAFVGRIFKSSAYNAGYDNGTRNPSKPETSTSDSNSYDSTSSDSSWSESGGSSSSSFGGCVMIVVMLAGGVIFIFNLLSGSQASRPVANPIPHHTPLPPPQQTISPVSNQISPLAHLQTLGVSEPRTVEQAHELIGKVYDALMKSLTPAQQKILRDEQREWIKWRDIQADRMARTFVTGPNSYVQDHRNAMISLLRDRTVYLREYRGGEIATTTHLPMVGENKPLSLEQAHEGIGRVYDALMMSLSTTQKRELRDEQRDWIKWRDIQADRIARTFATGPNSYPVDHEKAMISLLKERTDYLQGYKTGKVAANPDSPPPSDDACVKACIVFYNERGEWAGKASIRQVRRFRIEHVGPGRCSVHLDYVYTSNLMPDGTDQRIFHIGTNREGTWFVQTMDGYMSARF